MKTCPILQLFHLSYLLPSITTQMFILRFFNYLILKKQTQVTGRQNITGWLHTHESLYPVHFQEWLVIFGVRHLTRNFFFTVHLQTTIWTYTERIIMHKRQYDLLLVHFLRRRHRDEIKESKKEMIWNICAAKMLACDAVILKVIIKIRF